MLACPLVRLARYIPMAGEWLWPRSNNSFIPALGTAHFDLRRAQRALHFRHRVGVHSINTEFWKPGEPQSENACGFLLLIIWQANGEPG